MITPLKKTTLQELLDKPMLFDANIFMVGLSDRISDKNYSFENMKRMYLEPLFESFTDIYIHEKVYRELDEEARKLADSYKKVKIVGEGDLYGRDPKYTTIFNHIARHELVRYVRGQSKNCGEVYSLAYAAYHGINYFCSKDIMVDYVAQELADLKKIDIITFDIVLLTAYVYYAQKNDHTNSKGLKSMYKKHCADVIKRHGLPPTLSEYIRASEEYL